MASQSSAITTWPHSHTTNEVLIKIPIVFFWGGGGGGGYSLVPRPKQPQHRSLPCAGVVWVWERDLGGGGGGGGGGFLPLQEREQKWETEAIPLPRVMDGRAVDLGSSSVDEISTTKQPRLASSVS